MISVLNLSTKKTSISFSMRYSKNNDITIDKSGTHYRGLDIFWNYTARTVTISMQSYIPTILHHFNHPTPKKPTYSPSSWTAPKYSSAPQLEPSPDTSPPLSKDQHHRLQRIVGTLLYYARSVDPTLLVAIVNIASQQAAPPPNKHNKP